MPEETPSSELTISDPTAEPSGGTSNGEADALFASPTSTTVEPKKARRTRKKPTPAAQDPLPEAPAEAIATAVAAPETPGVEQAGSAPTAQPAKKTRQRKPKAAPALETPTEVPAEVPAESTSEASEGSTSEPEQAAGLAPGMLLFQAPAVAAQPRRRAQKPVVEEPAEEVTEVAETEVDEDDADSSAGRRKRRRGGRRRRKGSDDAETTDEPADEESADEAGDAESETDTTSRRRRRRRRAGEDTPEGEDDPENTVTRVRSPRTLEDEITSVSGSTRLEAKKQRRREGREAGRRRAPIVSEAEFLARREAVDRVMVIRGKADLTQIAVLEDGVLVEHYVARESQTSLIGNVYLGRVQNVLPSMEAAFVDIGKGRNAVLYAGEVNWSGLGLPEGQPRKIESVLSSGQSILVQVTKDPMGHKGARLTSQISLAGRFLVYVPDGTTSGISRKLPDTERSRLKNLLKEIVPDSAGVIVRTAAEGASEDELTRDVERLKSRWSDIEAKTVNQHGPKLLYGEPDLTLKVVRDLFTEDFSRLVVEGEQAWNTVHDYVAKVAPDLEPRVERYAGEESDVDVFAAYRVDEQIAKGLDRKVWLPSGGSLVIDRTEAMTVVDVNTGKFTGSGGNLEETVTKNNLEAAEEIVRQLRLRDIGGIIVIDFIDMVLESNRDLVLRRLVECLGRDRTRHQVAEVTSLGLVQMTRKRIGTGLLEAFSHSCEQCSGRGFVLQDLPVEPRRSDDEPRRGRRNRSRRAEEEAAKAVPSPLEVAAAVAAHHHDDDQDEEIGDDTRDQEPLEDLADGNEEPETAAEPEAGRPDDGQPDDGQPEVAPEPPKVITRTRRRVTARPAEPEAEPTPPVNGSTPTADAEETEPEPPVVEHVPVKRKGGRKR